MVSNTSDGIQSALAVAVNIGNVHDLPPGISKEVASWVNQWWILHSCSKINSTTYILSRTC